MPYFFSAAVIFSGQLPDVLRVKDKVENLIVAEGLKIVYIRTASKRLFIVEDGGGQ